MDWNLKGGSWDLTELDEAAALHNIDTVENNCNNNNNNNNNNNGSSRFGFGVGLVNRRSKGEFCVDLKLGHQAVNNSGTSEESSSVGVSKWKLDATGGGGGVVSKTTSSACPSSGSSKRARAMSNGGQTASCLVDGCNSDLSNCRDYHRRHKVCELHSKTPVVTIGGHKQRFCQQCSRFHLLEEFDEGKRSCRKRLDGHNRRRRKPQPVVPLTRPSATFFSNYQAGTQVLPLIPSSGSHHHVYGGSSGAVSPGWEGHGRFQQVHKQQELFLGSTSAILATPRISSSYSNSNSNKQQEMAYLEGDSKYVQVRSQNAGVEAAANSPLPPPCALSLLSSPVVQTTHSTPVAMTLVQPLGLTLHDHSLDSVDTTVLVNNNGTHRHHCHPSMYNNNNNNNMASDASSPHSLPFHWD